ncbi:MAG: ABC transporter permease [Ignavibacteriales bacterium CG18_big_fil_WC_8_21_14_2_50_31_20]|nr:MAG: ABC transporter permease [Ignavibacteriales bacterium CG18_big_fil_WC_8_21_14_2_50_31_20]
MDIPKIKYLRNASFQDKLKGFFLTISGLTIFNLEFFKQLFTLPIEIEQIKKHMSELGVKTFSIVSIMGFILGFVLALQSYPVLERFGATDFLPATVSLSIIRELAPILTALIFAGRVSSGIGAEISSMRVTEQIDAMEVSAVNPFKYLVVSRVIATTFILPILTIYVIMISLVGAFIAVIMTDNMSLIYFINAVVASISFGDFVPAILKTYVFGYIVGIAGSYKGYTADGGTEGVGRASTTAVVLASLLILIVDMVMVKITVWLWPSIG